MTPLTERQVERAFEMIESETNRASCIAIENACGREHELDYGDLSLRYSDFMDAPECGSWFPDFYPLISTEQIKQARLMMLATFYVLAGEL